MDAWVAARTAAKTGRAGAGMTPLDWLDPRSHSPVSCPDGLVARTSPTSPIPITPAQNGASVVLFAPKPMAARGCRHNWPRASASAIICSLSYGAFDCQ